MTDDPVGAAYGAEVRGDGVSFALYSEVAESVELCLFNEGGAEVRREALRSAGAGRWTTTVPGCAVGQSYGYRVHGPYQPDAGLRCNPNKLLLDPYARRLTGEFVWNEAVLGYRGDDALSADLCTIDSAPWVPRCVVTDPGEVAFAGRPDKAWRDTVICELNVRGYTMRHPELSARERGRFAGLSNGKILDYLRALGVTAVELMPVHAFIDEYFLHQQGLRNYWGYNTLNFFAPAGRYANQDPVGEFRAMTAAIHAAGMEVILDVVYNHTAETDELGPTVSFRGIDNQAYYRLMPDSQAHYINDTGCGNTLNVDHPIVQDLVLDSLSYWHRCMGVDGFRFDLAPVLGRGQSGFSSAHPLLERIETEPRLRRAKLIAEPWDIGPGGYQLGGFGPRWSEWNDQFRDSTRRFWRGDAGLAGEFARRLHGSADLFEHSGRGPTASLNFVTSHDGFTLADVVSYEHRRNLANGEDNRDGHAHNFSDNCGAEGPTDDPAVIALRRRQRLNFLATLCVSAGVPMLLAGDEFGHTQHGNNNAYAQDNELSWLDWSLREADPEFGSAVAHWTALRREEPLLCANLYRHGELAFAGRPDIQWLAQDGEPMQDGDWRHAQAFCMVLTGADSALHRIAVLLNAGQTPADFLLPAGDWVLRLATGTASMASGQPVLQDRSLAVLVSGVSPNSTATSGAPR